MPNTSIADLPEEFWGSDDHVLEVVQRQTPVVVQVGLVDHLLTHHSHLFLRQLVTGEFVQRLLQVGLADEVVVVEVLQKVEVHVSEKRNNHLTMLLAGWFAFELR